MKSFVAVTRLLRKKEEGRSFCYFFHFTGVYEGHFVKEILVIGEKDYFFDCGEDYLLYLGFCGIEKTRIRARLIKGKALKEISY